MRRTGLWYHSQELSVSRNQPGDVMELSQAQQALEQACQIIAQSRYVVALVGAG